MLEIKNINIRLGDFQLKNFSLFARQGDYLTVLGLSGAGKTVLLEILAGLAKPDSGQILLNGKDITHESIQKRPIGLVYQDMALFPHMRVEQNIGYALKSQSLSREQKRQKIKELSTQTHCDHLLDRFPGTLSGGEAQRVALARTLAANPQVLLLDEPLASLDIQLRQELRQLLKTINQSGKTIIHVTHDPMEAATLSKKIAIIEKGELLQWGDPHEVFRNPVSEFVARFSGIKNIFLCQFSPHKQSNGLALGTTAQGMPVFVSQSPDRETAHLMIPGEDIILSPQQLKTSAINQYHGIIREIYSLPGGIEVVVEAEGEKIVASITRRSLENLSLKPGDPIWLSFKATAVKIL